jgi:hypothetical protein
VFCRDTAILLVEILYRIDDKISIVYSGAKWIVPLIENLKSAGFDLIPVTARDSQI